MNNTDEMKNDTIRDLACLLMDCDANLSMRQALETVFNSETYQKLQNDRTHLYSQSARYVFSFLQQELATGKLG